MTLSRKATLLLLATTLIWGTTFFCTQLGTRVIKSLAPDASPLAWGMLHNALRFLLAAVVFAAACPRALRGMGRREWAGSFWLAFPAFVGIALGSRALVDGSSTVVAFLTNLTVIFVPVYGRLFFRERLHRGLLVGAALALAGVWILTHPTGGAFGLPEILTLGSALLFGLQIQLCNALTRDRDPEAMALGMFVHFAWLFLGGVALLPGGLSMLSPSFLARLASPMEAAAWMQRWAVPWTLAWMAVPAGVVTMWVFARYQREIPATRAAIIYCLEPAVAAAIGSALAGDPVTWRLFAGGGLIVGANLACEFLKPRRSEK